MIFPKECYKYIKKPKKEGENICRKDTLNKILSELSENSKKIFGGKLKKVILLGLYARGGYDDESDIDVMLMVDMSK
ncbi:MAG: nucleotidyltransferase domain-containing protein [Clostridiales bacterium]|nr:nucleotidyltransferase domain-containing protein [Clostridiales bacterium]